jgi:hypothetical protein
MTDEDFEGIIEDLEAKLAKAVEALDGLLEAITATTQHGDRSLTITGPTANLKWLLETEEEARALLAEIEGKTPYRLEGEKT